MSRSIDEKIVSMSFENSKFERNINQSIDSIDALQGRIDGLGPSKGLDSLSSSVESVHAKFSTLQFVAANVLGNLATQAINAGAGFAKSLSIDQVVSGFSKYEEKTTAVQTIMAATRKETESEAEALERVNAQIGRLNQFTDETSYSLTDMTNNIGKFTSQGVGLEDAVIAMEGISTWASVSGQGVNEASRVMYNLSQSLSQGSVRLQDWMSVENANMATKEFKETVLQTAIELGELNENTKITAETFRSSLSEGWLTSDVLMAALKKYGGFADMLLQWTDETDTTATELQEIINNYESLKLSGATTDEIQTFIEELDITSVSAERLTEILEEATKEEYALGRKAFRAAQEAKTFTEAINSVKDASSTTFMNIFESIFGDYLEAKDLWTDLANELYDVFVEPLNALNDLISEWGEKDVGGRDDLMTGFWNLFEAMTNVIKVVKDAWHSIFPPATVMTLTRVVTKFKEWSETVKDKSWDDLKRILRGIFALVKFGRMVIAGILDVLSPFKPLLSSIFDWLIDKLGIASDKMVQISEDSHTFGEVVSWLKSQVQKFVNSVTGFWTNVFGNKELNGVKDRWEAFKNWIKNEFGKRKIQLFAKKNGLSIEGITGVRKAEDAPILSFFKDFAKTLGKTFTEVLNATAPIFTWLTEQVGGIIKWVSENLVKLDFTDIFRGLIAGFVGVEVASTEITRTIAKFKLTEILSNVSWVIESVGDTIYALGKAVTRISKSVRGYLNAKKMRSYSKALLNVAVSVALIAGSLYLITRLDRDQMLDGAFTLAMVIAAMVGAVVTLNKLKMNSYVPKVIQKFSRAILTISVAIFVIAKALDSEEKLRGVTVGIALIAGIMVVLGVLVAGLSKINPQRLKTGSRTISKLSRVIGTIAIGLMLMAGAVALIKKAFGGQEDWKNTLISLGEMAGFLIVLSLIMKIIDTIKHPIKAALSISFVATGLMILAGALAIIKKLFGKEDWWVIVKTLSTIGIAVGEMAIACAVFSKIKTGNVLKTALAISLFGISLSIMAKPLAKIGKIKWGDLAKSFVAFAAGFTLFVLGAKAVQRMSIAGTMAKIAGVLLLVSLAALSLGASFSLIAHSMEVMSEITLEGSANMLAAMTAFGVGFGNIMKTVAATVLAIAPIIGRAIAVVIGELLSSIPTAFIVMISDLLATLEIYLPKIIEDALSLLAKTLNAVANQIGPVIDATVYLLSEILKGVNKAIVESSILDDLLTLVVGIIDKFATYISTHRTQIVKALEKLLNAIFDLLGDALGMVRDMLFGCGETAWDEVENGIEGAAKKNAPGLVARIMGMIVSTITGNKRWADEMTAAGQAIFDWVSGGFKENLFDLVEARRFEMGLTTVDLTVYDQSSPLAKIAEKNAEALGGKAYADEQEKTARYISDQILAGMEPREDKVAKLRDLWSRIGRDIPEDYKKQLNIKSPSKVMQSLAGYTIDGLVKGLDDNSKDIYKAEGAIIEKSKAIMQNLFGDIVSSMETSDEWTPTITPVLNLENIQNGASRLGSIFDGVTVDGSISSSVTANRGLDDLKSEVNDIKALLKGNGVESTTNYNTFNITGADPNEIANIVSVKLQREVGRRQAITQ